MVILHVISLARFVGITASFNKSASLQKSRPLNGQHGTHTSLVKYKERRLFFLAYMCIISAYVEFRFRKIENREAKCIKTTLIETENITEKNQNPQAKRRFS